MEKLKIIKKILFIAVLLAGISNFSFAQNPFITIWRTTDASSPTANAGDESSNKGIRIPVLGNTAKFSGSYKKVGADESTRVIFTDLAPLNNNDGYKFEFAEAGDYELVISAVSGNFSFQYANNATKRGDRLKLREIKQWGDIHTFTGGNIFAFCTNLQVTATDGPKLSGNIGAMFNACTELTGGPGFNNWNLDNVTDINNLFTNCANFNAAIDRWNTSGITNMTNLFNGAASFNQPIGVWDVSKVTNMTNLFNGAASFNQPIGTWDVSKVTNMSGMFSGATSFNQPVGSWNISSVTNMVNMFSGATAFNQNLGAWVFNAAVNTSNILTGTAVDCFNYEAALIGWDNGNSPAITFSANGRIRSSEAGQTAYQSLISKGWNISGDIYDGGVCAAGPPPVVTFSNLKARVFNGLLRVQWKTINEHNNEKFIIQTSKDGENWEDTAVVISKADINGNSTEILEYDHSIKYSTLQLAGAPVFITLLLAVLLFNRRKRLFISMALLCGIFLVNCKKSESIPPDQDGNTKDEIEEFYIRVIQVDKAGETSVQSDVIHMGSD